MGRRRIAPHGQDDLAAGPAGRWLAGGPDSAAGRRWRLDAAELRRGGGERRLAPRPAGVWAVVAAGARLVGDVAAAVGIGGFFVLASAGVAGAVVWFRGE